MSDLITTTLEKICLQGKGSIISGPFGSNISKKFFVKKGIPVIRGNNLSLNYEKFIDDKFVYITKEKADELKCYAYRNDLIFTAAGTIGQVGIIPENSKYEEYVISNKQIRARLDLTKVDLLYVYYWCSSPWIKLFLTRNNKGSTVPLLTLKEVKNIPITFPRDLEEQKKIVTVIDLLSKKININNCINNNLWQQLKIIYDYWFTQFEFPDENGNPYKSSGGTMVSNNKFSYEIPLNWKVCNLSENPLTTIIKPGIEKFNIKNYLATADVNGTNILTGSIIKYETRENRANMQPQINSVWFAKMKNSIKHLYLNTELSMLIENTILSTGFCGLQCKEFSFEYVASFIEHSYFETLKNSLAHGATQEAINNDDLCKVPFIVPSKKVLNLFHENTKSIYSLISQNVCENQELTNLRDWLLPMLMNGQIKFDD